MKGLPLASTTPPLRYDATCNRQHCDQPATHRCSVRHGAAEVHFSLVVCDACAPEMTLDDFVPASMWDKFLPLLRAAGAPWPVRAKCRVYLTRIEAP